MNVPDDNNDGKPDYDKYTGKSSSRLFIENNVLPVMDKFRSYLFLIVLLPVLSILYFFRKYVRRLLSILPTPVLISASSIIIVFLLIWLVVL